MSFKLCLLFKLHLHSAIVAIIPTCLKPLCCFYNGLDVLFLGSLVMLVVGTESDQLVNICSFAVRCDRRWPSTQ